MSREQVPAGGNSSPRRKRRRRNRVSAKRILLRWIMVFGGLGFVAASALIVYSYFTISIPDPNAYVTSQATILQYDDGSEIGRLGAQNRTSVPLAKIPIDLRHAVLAAEDRKFYTNHAISPTGILRAFYLMARGGAIQGGSTITQQYAKTAFLSREQTLKRKLKELIIAIKLENQLSKDEILESYLNTIYFGRGAYGVQTAAQQYFGLDVDQLSVRQSAVLASVLRSPSYYNPGLREGNVERLTARYNYTIKAMVAAGWADKKYLKMTKLPAIKARLSSGILAGPKGYLIAAIEAELNKLGFPDEKLMIGGLIVKTTLNRQAQIAAVNAVDTQGPKSGPANLRIGLASVRPGTGAIVAMYGGPDYLKQQLNNATQGIAQAGSTFKPFALIAGLEKGISLSSMWNGASPQTFDDAGKPYVVGNFGLKSFGEISLLQATASSVNTVYVPLGIYAGPENVIDAARRAGIPNSVELVATPSVVLGVASPRVIDVAAAYATFAAQGVYAKPYLIQDVTGRNKGLLYQATPTGQEVFAKDVMADLSYALQEVVRTGSGFAAKKLGRPSAGKTGTSQENASAWYSGYTPQLATAVGIYRDDATQSLRGTGGLKTVTGGSFPARIWTSYMKGALKGEPILDFPPPAYIGGEDPTPAPISGQEIPAPPAAPSVPLPIATPNN
jgi:hypothetical protein